MCGRGNHAGLTWAELVGWMRGLTPAQVEIGQYYNVPPTAQVPIIGRGRAPLGGAFARWGLVPRWHQGPLADWKAATFNARIETMARAPSFREAVTNGRCVVPFAGYYEWSGAEGLAKTGAATGGRGPKQPYYIHPAGNAPALLMAGLYTTVRLPDFTGPTCAVITEPARAPFDAIHHRMPVLLDPEAATDWLDGRAPEDLPRLPMQKLAWHKVGPAVGAVTNEGPELIAPL
ncbi:hypothetical protein CKO11_02695 [Rhodobacter sp. TJ_12]|uniref:SOS response-associated peptidase n=1 Tax=Rhodobacter sp. TJ_12 TaxID=2029399 RepID=UPI001CBED146|nr:SOS response-associated peptidase [Rhodobacter sp. TJ_12]MBZ4021370.1 hypothetical protein [Rhodobacter sp. TJ_12]